MKIFVITGFPKLVDGPFNESILKRAQDKNIVNIQICNLREYTTDKHRQIDDYPYGGGPGMILKPEPFFKAVEFIIKDGKLDNPYIVLMTPQGRTFNQKIANEFSERKELIFLCGHYKGVDERVRENLAHDELSIGDYILTGGELAAMVVIDSIVRLLPDAIGDFESAKTDTFQQEVFDCPYYTRPENLNGMKVPDVLLSGHHLEIENWRKQQAIARTKERRTEQVKTIDTQRAKAQ